MLPLQATNSFGCKKTDSKPKYIKISDGIQPEYYDQCASSCRLPVQYTFYTNNSLLVRADLSYEWNCDDGTTSTDITQITPLDPSERLQHTLSVRKRYGMLNTITRN
jgi:hypothetical protein